jgi:hypothetical protein
LELKAELESGHSSLVSSQALKPGALCIDFNSLSTRFKCLPTRLNSLSTAFQHGFLQPFSTLNLHRPASPRRLAGLDTAVEMCDTRLRSHSSIISNTWM